MFDAHPDQIAMIRNHLETDGQAGTVEVGLNGSAFLTVAIGAQELSYNGRRLLDADRPQDWSNERSR